MTIDELSLMSDAEKRIRIAELCAWIRVAPGGQPGRLFPCREYVTGESGSLMFPPPGEGGRSGLVATLPPDYLNSLDAMHEAEKVLDFDDAILYRFRLASNSGSRNATFMTVEAAMCHATARQRADAFLLTVA